MTIHTAKGLEFPVVVIAGCEDDILPHINSARTRRAWKRSAACSTWR